MKNLQQNNQYLGQLSNSDYITTLGNQRFFETSLNQVWSMVAEKEVPISIILLDVDHLKIYSKHFGWEAGNESFRQIAHIIDNVTTSFYTVGTFMIKTARLGGGEFGILLPGRETLAAFEIAEIIRNEVFNLGISHDQNVIFGLAASVLTVSSGIACTLINDSVSPNILIQAARDALYQSKRNGRNTTSVSTSLNGEFSEI
jgi:diguanylate cyclase (GGDEF)-like protein